MKDWHDILSGMSQEQLVRRLNALRKSTLVGDEGFLIAYIDTLEMKLRKLEQEANLSAY